MSYLKQKNGAHFEDSMKLGVDNLQGMLNKFKINAGEPVSP